jgi:hypothetical protein
VIADSNQSIDAASSVKPINLRECFGDRFQVENEAGYASEYGDGSRCDDPWLFVIPCVHGQIFPWASDRLAVSTTGPGKVANLLRRLACCSVAQDGDDGFTGTFVPTDFPKVADIVKPRRSRKLSEQRRQALEKAGQPFRYRSVATELDKVERQSGDQ